MKKDKTPDQLNYMATFNTNYEIVPHIYYEVLMEKSSRFDLAEEVVQSDLYIGDKIRFLEMIFGIEKDEDEKGDKS